MSTMTSHRRMLIVSLITAALLPAAGAQAQLFGNTSPLPPLFSSTVGDKSGETVAVAPKVYSVRKAKHASVHPQRKAERVPIKEARKRALIRRAALPRQTLVIEQRHGGKMRVIRAEAEVTILGPDRITIRLVRKGRTASASAH